MPPKRGKKAAAAAIPTFPLDGCVIAFSGTFKGFTHGSLKAKAEALGATVSASVTPSTTTHLIATETDYKKRSAKVTGADDDKIPIVTVDWLLTCEQDNQRAAEKDYAIGTVTPIPIRVNGAAPDGGSRKRARSPAPDTSDNDSAPPKPKTRATKATKANRAPAAETMADEEDQVAAEDAKPTTSKPLPAIGEGQVLKKKDIQIPLDEGCPFTTSTVYVAPDSVIFDASLNQTHASRNNNKFYRIQLVVDPKGVYRVWTRWGRVGEHGQSATLGGGSLEDALKQFQKKFKDKSGLAWNNRGDPPKAGKYAFVERNYNEESDEEEETELVKSKGKEKAADWVPPKCALHPAVQKLLELIFNQQFFAAAMSSLNYDANKMPLGKLSKATITRGFQALKELSALIDDQSLATSVYGKSYQTAVEDLSNSFYSVIPHDFRRNRPPIISTQPMVKKEIELLESLSDMKDAALIMKLENVGDEDIHPVDKQYQGLGMQEMTPLGPDSTEYTLLHEYLMNTRGATHGFKYNVEAIFRIERQGEQGRFESAYAKTAKNRRLLWHGSRSTNFGGILSQGLRIAPPEAPVTGYMFGKGIYLADMSSKSAGYCFSGLSDNTGLLLLCEAELGDPMQELICASYNAGDTAKKQGMLSTWGQGRTGPTMWKDAACVHPSLAGIKMPDTSVLPGDTGVNNASLFYNEYICYDVAQVRLRYLFRVKMNY